MKHAPKLRNPICIRHLHTVKEGRKRIATIELAKPKRHGKDWVCAFYVSGIGMRKPVDAFGVDGLQALTQALEGVRKLLQQSGRWSWIYGSEGDTAVPRLVPMGFGKEFASKIETFIDSETEKFAVAAERKAISGTG